MANSPRQNRWVIVSLLFANFALFGSIATVVGATLPVVIRDLRWSYLTAGFMIAANSVGFFTSTFFSGLLCQRVAFKTMVCMGLAGQALGLACFGVWEAPALNFAAFVILGLGQGMVELSTNHRVLQLEHSGQSRLMNFIHSAFTLGAISSPLLSGYLISRTIPWRYAFGILSGSCLLMILAFAFRQETRPVVLGTAPRLPELMKKVGRHRLIWLLSCIIMLYVGAEIGISSWISELYVSHFRSEASTGAYLVSLFWGGILAGRMWVALGNSSAQSEKLLVRFAGFSLICLIAALGVDQAFWSALFYLGTGVGYSTIYPTIMSIVGKEFPEAQGIAVGIVSAGGGVGVCVFPFFMSLVANQHGVEAGFLFYLGLTLVMAAMAAWVYFEKSLAHRLNP